MSTERNSYSAEANREKLVNAMPDEALTKRLQLAIDSTEIWEKGLDLLRKRIASGELSHILLLRMIDTLAKSTACFAMDGRPQVKRPGRTRRSGHQSRRAPKRRKPGQSR